MEVVNQILGFISNFFTWWYTVMTWEQAIFIRAGKNPKVVNNGMYFKIPFIDRVYIQQIRLRVIDMPIQTVSTQDGKTITIKAMVGYSIKDMLKMYNSISHPEMTLSGIIMGGIADHIKNKQSSEISPLKVEEFLIEKLKETDFGLGDLSIKITSWAEVRTYRLIQDQSWMGENLKMTYNGEKQ